MTTTTAAAPPRARKAMDSLTQRYLVLIGLIVIASVGFSIANDNFYSLANIGILLRSIAVLFLLSMGMTFIMLTGGIDLSVGSNVAFAGGVGVIALTATGSAPLGFIAAIGAGMAVGAINGVFIGRLRLSAFMVTLATFALARGLALVIYDANSINVSNATFLWLGGMSWGNMPVVIPFVALVFAALSVLLYRSTFGRDLYAAGSNLNTAFVLGRRPERTLVWVYVLSGALAGLSAIITVGRVSSGQPWAGLYLEFDAITAVILGGTSLFGGRGRLLGTILGVLLYGIIINGLVLTGTNPYLQSLIKGLILLGVVLLDTLVQRRQAQ
ncbi:ABC transporter permease [Mameliella sediminis]|uniref:ABC transporter permease n=1 Tax=Mameliella sediminis TaxID=2836866 RepID=UPI001C438F80|nr:ABC transporter permease [Mameliella sediminis]MBY6144724.1 ABC transporter permease [Mameliella alba]MBV7395838.1 ABC transporter permease [Mameliella sediminis]MBY6160251.1 ABC transporter permease [Mameliella alba]MBY6168721.1 ABC transporter permease [Mameliella alba]MBY6174058.1 ABC transporter permease [Mameliella alba]